MNYIIEIKYGERLFFFGGKKGDNIMMFPNPFYAQKYLNKKSALNCIEWLKTRSEVAQVTLKCIDILGTIRNVNDF